MLILAIILGLPVLVIGTYIAFRVFWVLVTLLMEITGRRN